MSSSSLVRREQRFHVAPPALMHPCAGLSLSALALGSVMLANSRPLSHFFSETLAEPVGSPYTAPLGGAAKAD